MSDKSDETEKLAASLRKSGIRVTKQRVALMSVLASADDHPDAIELHDRARAIEPSVSLATVYRTLSVLEEGGVVHRHSFDGGGARFETTHDDHHDHILDVDTGEVTEFQSDKIEKLQDEIARELGYEVVHHRLELYCRKIKG
ncbi:Fur family transcriptional regulator [Sulfitobacter sp. HNIBRBA3233]|uniref:Fur family transcriptional regulator n=1 Tax=Sulfitobacter marinivivus TaxID=3158558 RepID=UPI0032E01092